MYRRIWNPLPSKLLFVTKVGQKTEMRARGTLLTFQQGAERTAWNSCSSIVVVLTSWWNIQLQALNPVLDWVLPCSYCWVLGRLLLGYVQEWTPWWKEHAFSLRLNSMNLNLSAWESWAGITKERKTLKLSVNMLQDMKWLEWIIILEYY